MTSQPELADYLIFTCEIDDTPCPPSLPGTPGNQETYLIWKTCCNVSLKVELERVGNKIGMTCGKSYIEIEDTAPQVICSVRVSFRPKVSCR